MNTSENDARQSTPKREQPKPYEAPRIEPRGDVRGVTLGGSPGIGDSGTPGIQEP